LHQFLQDEDGAGDRRVEGGAEARAGPAAINTRQSGQLRRNILPTR